MKTKYHGSKIRKYIAMCGQHNVTYISLKDDMGGRLPHNRQNVGVIQLALRQPCLNPMYPISTPIANNRGHIHTTDYFRELSDISQYARYFVCR